MAEEVQTGGLMAFRHSGKGRKLELNEKIGIEEAYAKAEERKRKERQRRILFLGLLLVILLIIVGGFFFFR